MSDLRNVVKNGWHPKGKDGGKESWRGDFKGINQVAGWMGKGKKPGGGDDGGSGHISRPLATLKDPALFGPPPKNVNYHGGAALPNEITPHTSGLGAPLTHQELESVQAAAQHQAVEEPTAEEQAVPAGPPLPFRADRTGLRTDHLPPPPVHRDLHNTTIDQPQPSRANPTPQAKPGLPPRLPARQNSSTASIPVATTPPPPAYEPATRQPQPSSRYINQNAANRLAKAGVSVPGFGIGEANPWKTERAQAPATTSPPPASTNAPAQLNELQARFARMSSRSTSSPQTPTEPQSNPLSPQPTQPTQPTAPPAEGTTLAQKQAAFQTAQSFHRDPSSVTLADAKSAASTANNFRERHQDQIAAGATKANSWNKKYNVTGRLNTFLEKQVSPASEPPAGVAAQTPPAVAEVNASALARKPPPPPPPMKPASMHAPPPVPLGTKPNFG